MGQDGGHRLMNHHYDTPEERYALDIVRLNEIGSSKKIGSDGLSGYAIYGQAVYSPARGKVYKVVNHVKDQPPSRQNRQFPPGNFVVIENEAYIILAHLKPGSIRVKTGDTVQVGDLIGLVGNSGMSSEPHLHIHAVDKTRKKSLPLMFDGDFLVRNELVVH
ncbi:M23 family metallopeptidase [Laceyella putida]|uniref:M23 family metallopeptidase n=1 Tax=Laceyella putida TaxID=110101 RepID=A0ABW2RFA1_9BACL